MRTLFMTIKFYRSSRAFFIFSTCSDSDKRIQQSVQWEQVASTGRFFLNLCDIREVLLELIASLVYYWLISIIFRWLAKIKISEAGDGKTILLVVIFDLFKINLANYVFALCDVIILSRNKTYVQNVKFHTCVITVIDLITKSTTFLIVLSW